VLHVLAIVLAVIAALSMFAALVGLVTGRPGERPGTWLRVLAVLAFAGAVGCNLAAR
jgi:hypothetical protein